MAKYTSLLPISKSEVDALVDRLMVRLQEAMHYNRVHFSSCNEGDLRRKFARSVMQAVAEEMVSIRNEQSAFAPRAPAPPQGRTEEQ